MAAAVEIPWRLLLREGVGVYRPLWRFRCAPQVSLLFLLALGSSSSATAQTNSYSLGHASAPTNNPLKGFMPYAGNYSTFPYSMEWSYLPLRSLMSGPTNFNWSSLDTLLDSIASRGHQTVFRIYLDYPGKSTGIPQYLLDAGLVTRSYTDYGNGGQSISPDYENLLLRQALTNFVTALGARYDGDPRIGFITVGLLGFWGEWHTFPHTDWFASTTVQNEILTAFGLAFTRTKCLVRRPAGTNPSARRLGYHDDSFAYETVDPPEWMFLGLLKAAGETNKWRTQPIGGEVRPEVQLCMWDNSQSNCVPAGQEFNKCVDLTHASWMLNHQAFSPGFTGAQKALALAGSARLGYELYVSNAVFWADRVGGSLNVQLQVWNTGVAPFYYGWPVQLGVLSSSNTLVKAWMTGWNLSTVLPSTNTLWDWNQTSHGLQAGQYKLLLRVQNPLTNGVSFRFANEAQDSDLPGWLTLGQFSIAANRDKPTLRGSRSSAGFDLDISNAPPGNWVVQRTTNFQSWISILSTNTSTSQWSITDALTLPAGFYRAVGVQ